VIARALLAAALLVCATGAWAQAAGRFAAVQGAVQLTDRDGRARPAAIGEALNEGDTIATGRAAIAIVRFADGGVISMRPDSQLRVGRFSYRGENDAAATFLLDLVRGGFRSVTGAIARLNRPGYQVTTPTSTIGIRGTDHEPMVILPPAPGESALGTPGSYDKVNEGRTVMTTERGEIEIGPGQVGFVPRAGAIPLLLPGVPSFYREQPRLTGPVPTVPTGALPGLPSPIAPGPAAAPTPAPAPAAAPPPPAPTAPSPTAPPTATPMYPGASPGMTVPGTSPSPGSPIR